MTSEPDGRPERRPPTIELKAREVEAEKAESTSQTGAAGDTGSQSAGGAAAEPAASRSGGSAGRYALGALGGAVVMAAILGGLWVAGFAPPRPGAGSSAPPTASPPAPPPADSRALNDITARLETIQHALQAPQPDTALTQRLTAAEAETKSLRDSLAALNRRLDDVAADAQAATKQAAAAQTAANAAQDAAKSAAANAVQRSDIDGLVKRIAALESTLKSLSDTVAHRPASADDHVARLVVAAEALRATLERGAPYADELAAVRALGADREATAQLQPFAAEGVPTAAALGRELASLVPRLRRAADATPNNDASFFERLESNAQKLVRITPVDAPLGSDTASVIARLDSDAAHADIDGALAAAAQLPDNLRPLVADWVKKAQARNAAIAAARRIAADALAAINKPAAQ